MTATALGPYARPGGAVNRRIGEIWQSPVARGVVVSRLVVLAAGAAGASQPRRTPWDAFDATHISQTMGAVGNVLGATGVRWDAIHYLQIAAHGYVPRSINTVFYPLYPLLMRIAGLGTGSLPLGGMLVSLIAFVVAMWLLGRVTEDELGRRAARATVILVAFAPLAFFFTAVYTESLFLALSLGCFYAARRERWWLAVALGALAALTRVNGALLVVPLAIIAWEGRAHRLRRIGALAVIPAAMVGYFTFLALHGLDPLSPIRGEASFGRVTAGPLGTMIHAVASASGGLWLVTAGPERIYEPAIQGPLSIGAESILLLLVLCASLWALRLAWQRLSRPLLAYAVAALVLCLWSPTTWQPLVSFDRYLLTIFPLWMAAGAWLSERERTRILVSCVSAALLAFYAFQFATWAFIA